MEVCRPSVESSESLELVPGNVFLNQLPGQSSIPLFGKTVDTCECDGGLVGGRSSVAQLPWFPGALVQCIETRLCQAPSSGMSGAHGGARRHMFRRNQANLEWAHTTQGSLGPDFTSPF